MDAKRDDGKEEKQGGGSDSDTHFQGSQSEGGRSLTAERARRARRLRLNRESARERRKKRKLHLEGLEKKVQELRQMSDAYSMSNRRLQFQVNELRAELVFAQANITEMSNQSLVPQAQHLHQVSSQPSDDYGLQTIQQPLSQSQAVAYHGRTPSRSPDWLSNSSLPYPRLNADTLQQHLALTVNLPQPTQSIPRSHVYGTGHPGYTSSHSSIAPDNTNAAPAQAAWGQQLAGNQSVGPPSSSCTSFRQQGGQAITPQHQLASERTASLRGVASSLSTTSAQLTRASLAQTSGSTQPNEKRSGDAKPVKPAV